MTTKVGKLPGYDQALKLILAEVPRLGVEHVRLCEARGRVLREEISADRDQPPFNRSAMDGFAVRSCDVYKGATLPVTATIPAGDPDSLHLKAIAPNTAMRIATGAPLPVGADAVVPHELATVSSRAKAERVTFGIASLEPWENVHRCGSDTQVGAPMLRAGTILTPQQIGIAATVGKVNFLVSHQPRISLITSGDEVRPPETPTAELKPQQIRNSNGPTLCAFLAALGLPVQSHDHVPDEAQATVTAAHQALERSDLVVTVGGVSAGQRDWLPWAWSHLGLVTVIHGAAIQPGKPVFVARPATGSGKLVVGLPGNPVSVLATAHLFLWPVLASAMGSTPPTWRKVCLSEPAQSNPVREMFRAATLGQSGSACVIPWNGSGDLTHTADADGWVRIRAQNRSVEAGTHLPFLPLIQ